MNIWKHEKKLIQVASCCQEWNCKVVAELVNLVASSEADVLQEIELRCTTQVSSMMM